MFKEALRVPKRVYVDPWLISAVTVLLVIGILMVTSASSYTTERYEVIWYHYTRQQAIFIVGGIFLGWVAFRMRLTFWRNMHFVAGFAAALLLALVLIPGIGREINGSMRWIPIGPINFQPSEMAKLLIFIYVAAFLDAHYQKLRKKWVHLGSILLVLGFYGVLLLLEPDFGSTVVMLGVGLSMVFIAGVSMRNFLVVIIVTVGGMLFVLFSASYRVARLKTFLNPWDDKYGEGFQLINSLMAIGRGEWMGVGIGEGVQKLGYLPESHTDFIFAVYAEETGLLGVVILIAIFTMLLSRAFIIGKRAEFCNMRFGAYLSYGIGMWIVGQAFINLAVAMGRLPTKGLTLPLLSYGGSSIVTLLIVIGILCRIDVDSQRELIKRTQVKVEKDEANSEAG